ncbi:uncharacterized protein LODBEIA_P33600 [Lodderomyces beijingensis]|uniref:mitogen-activated protein kinase kinase n=1 Tax=Lodderomyces beijingensis TaxID=1775926 RepID=A0ABP0ZQD1_9ASCO
MSSHVQENEDHNVSQVDDKLQNLNLKNQASPDAEANNHLQPKSGGGPPLASPPIHASSVSTPTHTPLNSDIQARLMAFQQRRSKPASEPVHVFNPSQSTQQGPAARGPPPPHHNPVSSSDSLLETVGHQNKLGVESLQSSTMDMVKAPTTPSSAASSRLSQNSSITPPNSDLPNRGGGVGGGFPRLNLNANGTPTQELGKKPSLSQRRGMKLNTSAMPLGSPSNTPPSSSSSPNLLNPPIKLNTSAIKSPGEEQNSPFALSMGKQFGTTNELSRRLSERKKKPNFKLNLDDSGSGMPSRNNSLSKTTTSSSSDSNHDFGNQASKSDGQLQGLFANYSKYIDIKSGQLNFAGKASLHSKGIDFSSGSSFRISLDEFEYLEELGRGNYGSVSKVLHKPTGVLMAMKEVRLELDETKFTQILMELDILHKCNSPYIVDFYGAFFVEGAVYMCIEYMDGGSLDQIFGNNIGVKDEAVLAYITESVIRGLKELKDVHNIIHRDVKPTNILVNSAGKVKLCDFGVSGNLVASMAKTNIGCQSYMAPERIKTTRPDDATYSVQSDIWSLGLTILEIACGHYPYPPETFGNIFSQLSAIVDGEPPKLDSAIFSKEAQFFVKTCLNKNPDLRPAYGSLLQNPWLVSYRGKETNLDQIVQKRLGELKEDKKSSSSTSTRNAASIPPQAAKAESVNSLLKNKVRAPALHRGGLQSVNTNFLNR